MNHYTDEVQRPHHQENKASNTRVVATTEKLFQALNSSRLRHFEITLINDTRGLFTWGSS